MIAPRVATTIDKINPPSSNPSRFCLIKPPTRAPAIPIRAVTIMPPGSSPGMINLPKAPAMSPITIHATISILLPPPSSFLHTVSRLTASSSAVAAHASQLLERLVAPLHSLLLPPRLRFVLGVGRRPADGKGVGLQRGEDAGCPDATLWRLLLEPPSRLSTLEVSASREPRRPIRGGDFLPDRE